LRAWRAIVTILSLMREIARTRGMAILCTLHQLTLADRVVAMESARLTP
jgi:ABC-type cobalamin/Fe3+-siderophores transport system ATPase subunit